MHKRDQIKIGVSQEKVFDAAFRARSRSRSRFSTPVNCKRLIGELAYVVKTPHRARSSVGEDAVKVEAVVARRRVGSCCWVGGVGFNRAGKADRKRANDVTGAVQ